MYKEFNDSVALSEEPLGFFPNEVSIKPFLKWAGGKTQLIPELSKLIPIQYNKYIEPFIGGGAFFFFLNPEKSIISDSNSELIITYKAVRDNVEAVIKLLSKYKNEETFFYKIRSLDTTKLTDIERAARLIYLNKTCFNGLYRVNKKGEFNVPFGKRDNNFLNKETLRDASEFLQRAKIINSDYLKTLQKHAKPDDFIFLDPPYYPVGKFSDFKRYTKEFFYHEDQVKLRDEFDRLVQLGCYIFSVSIKQELTLNKHLDHELAA